MKPADLRGILNYVPRFKDQIFVIALDGSIVADENLGNLLVDIAVLRSLAIKVILVHGIGQQIRQLSATRSIPITDATGAGVTDAATLDLAIRASSRLSHLILEGLTQNALKCAITNAIRALPLGILRGIDHQYTGKVDRIDTEFLTTLIDKNITPIITPIGFGPDGGALRINSDLLAAELAEALHATKILYAAPAPGLTINNEIRREISADALRALLQEHPAAIPENERSKAEHALKAIATGTPRVHLIDGRALDSLLNEIFSNEGVGTLIYGNDYQQIRRARRADVRAIHNLTRGGVRRAELLHRTRQAIEKNIDQFYVYEIDENLIACISLAPYPETPALLELGTLYVQPFYQNRGIGRKLVDYTSLLAKARGARTLIALSTQNYSFFTTTMGFEEADKTLLPPARLKLYEESGRNAKVLIKQL
ncbi:MAG: amino-acid N-acetyltransferase [Opitutaceae bacterium]|nr:amino-acid N-acetyltransferase [Opitutaceae bacterium]